jgi:hypothetical protein
MVRCNRVDKARRLLAIDSLVKVSMKKCVLHIQLVNGLGSGGDDDEDDSNHLWLDDATKGLIVFDVVALVEATDHPACFVSGKSTISTTLFEDPLAYHNVSPKGARDEVPCVIFDKSLKLLSHGSAPIWVA